MKLSSVVATLLAVSPLTKAAMIRSKQEQSFKTSKAQIVLQGVPQDFSAQDLAVINKSAIAAYNGVQKDSGYSLTSVKPLLHFGTADSVTQCEKCPPDDDAFALGPSFKFAGGVSQCEKCPPDDDAFSLGEERVLVVDVQVSSKQCEKCPPDDDVIALEDASNHKLFVESFCDLLTVSGSKNLAGARHCSFTFLESPGHDVAPISYVKDDEKAHGFLSLTGLLHELSAEDIAIVESSTIETYNRAFSKTGHAQLNSLNIRSVVETPKAHEGIKQCEKCPPDDDFAYTPSLKQCEKCPPDDDFISSKQCEKCPPDDDSFLSGEGSVLLMDIGFAGVTQCEKCPPDDDAIATIQQCLVCDPTADLQKVVYAFSRALCAKLRSSGSPNLAFAHGCAMDFFYEHTNNVAGETA